MLLLLILMNIDIILQIFRFGIWKKYKLQCAQLKAGFINRFFKNVLKLAMLGYSFYHQVVIFQVKSAYISSPF